MPKLWGQLFRKILDNPLAISCAIVLTAVHTILLLCYNNTKDIDKE